MKKIVIKLINLMIFSFILSFPLKAQDMGYVTMGSGVWEILREHDRSLEFNISYIPNYRLWILRPQAGLLWTNHGEIYGWGGLSADIQLPSNWLFTVSTGVGGYDGKRMKLGSMLEFRSSLDLNYRLNNESQLGMSFNHISNGGITKTNYGSESLLLVYTFALKSF